MRKLVLACISNTLMLILPLLAAPSLILHFKILLLVVSGICIWLTQPAFTMEETAEQKDSDRFSVVLILSMSLISIVAPVVDWAYVSARHSAFSIFSIIGLVMIVVGIVFRAWAIHTLGRYFTPTVQIKDGHQLITQGPYSIVRHPSYTGAFLSITGSAVLLESWIGFVIAFLAMSTAYYVRIKIEESELTSYFGHNYLHYKQKTKKIIPFIW